MPARSNHYYGYAISVGALSRIRAGEILVYYCGNLPEETSDRSNFNRRAIRSLVERARLLEVSNKIRRHERVVLCKKKVRGKEREVKATEYVAIGI